METESPRTPYYHTNAAATTKKRLTATIQAIPDPYWSTYGAVPDLSYGTSPSYVARYATIIDRPSQISGQFDSYYYRYLQNKGYTFQELVTTTRSKFETEERANRFLSRWFSLTFTAFREEENYWYNKTIEAQLEAYARELQSLQLGLKDDNMRNDKTLRDRLLQGVSGNKIFDMALFNPPPTFPALLDSLRAVVSITRIVTDSEDWVPADRR
ncbi:hypothetical protein IFR05_011752 [Cadophora sp. M221]|nr:hypothetical protein IFR05_011752 [Cadophora sp. M221]